MSMYIIDASVFNKTFLDESDSRKATAFCNHAVDQRLPFGAPELLKLEACGAALHYGKSFSVPLRILDNLTRGGFEWIQLETQHWHKAEEICSEGSSKSGYPSLTDSLYHAAAIIRGGTFLTADRKHARKAGKFGHLTLFEDWVK